MKYLKVDKIYQNESEKAREKELGRERDWRGSGLLVRFVPARIFERLRQLARPQGQQQGGHEHEQAVVKHDSVFT